MARKLIDFRKLTPIDQIKGFDTQDTQQLQQMSKQSKAFLHSFDWCRSIEQGWFGWGIGKVCAVFLFRITPSRRGVDRWLWVIVGDLPPAYLVVDDSPTPKDALKTYIGLMQHWVDAVNEGTSVEDCIPVNAPPTKANARALGSRLEFLRRRVLKTV
jgi:hypothetical protein